MVVDNAARRLTKQYPVTTTSTTTTSSSYGYSDRVNDYSSTFAGAMGENSLVDLDDGLRTSASGAVFVGPPLSVASRMDLDAAARRRLSDGGLHPDERPSKPGGRRTTMPPPAAPLPGSSAAGRLLGDLLGPGQRSSSPRVRGAVLAKSCGDALLQRAAAAGLSLTSASPSRSGGRSSASTARSRGGTPSAAAGQQSSARVAGIRSSLSSSRLSDVGGGASGGPRVPSYLALDDHRYTLRVPPPPTPPPSKIQKTESPPRSSGLRQSASSGSLVGVTSILEAFLRTTRPMDPNKGSNAALAAAGLSHLPLSGDQPSATRGVTAADHGVDDGTLLKKLLTGEIDQSDVQDSFPAGTEAASTTEAFSDVQTTRDGMTSTVDSLLAEGFEFGYLDDPQSISLNLLDDVVDDGLWITAHADDFDDKVDNSTALWLWFWLIITIIIIIINALKRLKWKQNQMLARTAA